MKKEVLCEGCDKAIPAGRIKALPNVKTCVSCAEDEERSSPSPVRHDIIDNTDGLGDILSGND